VSVKSQQDTEHADLEMEREALPSNHDEEQQELAAIYRQRGLDQELAGQVARQLMKHDSHVARAPASGPVVFPPFIVSRTNRQYRLVRAQFVSHKLTLSRALKYLSQFLESWHPALHLHNPVHCQRRRPHDAKTDHMLQVRHLFDFVFEAKRLRGLFRGLRQRTASGTTCTHNLDFHTFKSFPPLFLVADSLGSVRSRT
jgi:hypothetical protein